MGIRSWVRREKLTSKESCVDRACEWTCKPLLGRRGTTGRRFRLPRLGEWAQVGERQSDPGKGHLRKKLVKRVNWVCGESK